MHVTGSLSFSRSDSTSLDTRITKLAVGCSFLLIGLVVALSAAYWHSRVKCANQFISVLNEMSLMLRI